MVADQVVLVVQPVLVFTEAVPPACGLGNEAWPCLVDPLPQTFDIFRWRHCPVIEVVFVDSIREQHREIRVAAAQA